ncbi:MAG: hypothetical protein VXW26_13700 [SAR324 cluster bacterium]|nr:hypothetical protein [SAR324 cluster bacterium]
MREVTMASVAHEKPELSTETVMKRRCRKYRKNLNLKRAGAKPRKPRCVGQVWLRSALLEVMKKGPQIGGLSRQLARREIITKNVAPSCKKFQKRLAFKGAGATPPKTHCIHPVWRRSSRLKAMDKDRDIDGFSP